ncbi:S-adenosyl-L-methionine-dependent methyltransferase [Lentinula raphanica]|nr:S-adenosyl-L-methionine-dependent methyltransferase [Lentinula raphanica]
MNNQSSRPDRFYASSRQYLLPADKMETKRLDKQHDMLTALFGGSLSVAPTHLTTGDRVLESAAGSGIWALQFFERNRAKGITLDIECIDMSSAQFPANHPTQVHFSVNSVANLPDPEWSDTFSYAHQRLLVGAANDSLWRTAVAELYRVLEPGGWVELVELQARDVSSWSVGPNSARLGALLGTLFDAKGVIEDFSVYLPEILQEAGFVNVKCEPRRASVGGELLDHTFPSHTKTGYESGMLGDLWAAMKGPVVESGGYGIVDTAEEYEALVKASVREWKASKEAYTTFYAIVGQKPMADD